MKAPLIFFTHKHIINLTALFLITITGSLFLWISDVSLYLNPLFITLSFLLIIIICLLSSEKISLSRKVTDKTVLVFELTLSFILVLSFLNYVLNFNYSLYSLFSVILICFQIYYFTNSSFEKYVYILFISIFVLLLSRLPQLNLDLMFFKTSSLVILISVTERLLSFDRRNNDYYLIAAASGILLYTAPILFIPALIYFIFFFRSNLFNLFLFFSIILFTVIILHTMIVQGKGENIYLFHFYDFSAVLIIIYGIIIIAAGWMARNIQEVFFVAILLYFILVFKIYAGMIKVFVVDGTSLLFDESTAGIMIILMLLSIFTIKSYRVDRFLGRIIPHKERDSV